jgi:hypothetical protein
MPLCTCKKCLTLTNGTGKELHRTTVSRHIEREQMNQGLENEYQNFHPEEENFYEEEPEERNLDNERSPMEISDNEETLVEENLTTLHNNEAPMETPSSFQNEETNDDYYHENDDLNYYDSQSESEFEDFDDKEGEFK